MTTVLCSVIEVHVPGIKVPWWQHGQWASVENGGENSAKLIQNRLIYATNVVPCFDSLSQHPGAVMATCGQWASGENGVGATDFLLMFEF